MSGPHQSNIGNRLPRMTPSMVFILLGQSSAGPSFVLGQSVERMSAAISPPPTNRSLGALAEATATGNARLFLIGHPPVRNLSHHRGFRTMDASPRAATSAYSRGTVLAAIFVSSKVLPAPK